MSTFTFYFQTMKHLLSIEHLMGRANIKIKIDINCTILGIFVTCTQCISIFFRFRTIVGVQVGGHLYKMMSQGLAPLPCQPLFRRQSFTQLDLRMTSHCCNVSLQPSTPWANIPELLAIICVTSTDNQLQTGR